MVACSPRASADQTVRLWDVADPSRSRPAGQPLVGHTAAIVSSTFSPDGRQLATASADGVVRVWDMATTVSVSRPFVGHTGGVTGVSVQPRRPPPGHRQPGRLRAALGRRDWTTAWATAERRHRPVDALVLQPGRDTAGYRRRGHDHMAVGHRDRPSSGSDIRNRQPGLAVRDRLQSRRPPARQCRRRRNRVADRPCRSGRTRPHKFAEGPHRVDLRSCLQPGRRSSGLGRWRCNRAAVGRRHRPTARLTADRSHRCGDRSRVQPGRTACWPRRAPTRPRGCGTSPPANRTAHRWSVIPTR